MRRGTPAAKLFGELLIMIRLAGAGSSMRRIAESLGAPPATVSQIEKGQRALKEPKIRPWAQALGVDEAALRELWHLSQGQILLNGRWVFYADHPDVIGPEPRSHQIDKVLGERPDLRSIYCLAEQIAGVLRRLLPDESVWVESRSYFWEWPGHEGPLTEADHEEIDRWRAESPMPCICRPTDEAWGLRTETGEIVEVPEIKKPAPIARRRGKSMEASELEDLVRGLTGPERERVRGYIEAIIEDRADH